MSSSKVRAGVSFDPSLVAVLDEHAKKLATFQVDRSEIVNAILGDYLQGNGTTESIWGAVSKRRMSQRT
jgi:metal-responsive CopG/Arc/MetJ family transcriptional regulator